MTLFVILNRGYSVEQKGWKDDVPQGVPGREKVRAVCGSKSNCRRVAVSLHVLAFSVRTLPILESTYVEGAPRHEETTFPL